MPVLYPLGYPVQVATASKAVLEAAAQSWGHWAPLFDSSPIRIDIEASDHGTAADVPTFRPTSTGFEFFADSANRAAFDYQQRSGSVRVTRATLDQSAWFRYHFLEALTMTALDSVAFTPIHAACVARYGRGLLLCGASGAGKSSLAYACARQGWTFVSDDAVHAVSGGDGQVIGNCYRAQLREPSVALFPEIASAARVRQPNGKWAIEIPMAGDPAALAGGCVFLCRTRERVGLTPLDPDHARAYFREYLHWGDPRTQEADLERILRHGCWRLEYHRFDDAIAMLEDLAR